MLHFPENFLFGSSTSHFQVEGIDLEFQRNLSDWSIWTKQNNKIKDSTSPYPGSAFSLAYAQDIELAYKLNLKAFRFSLNWAYLCPNPPDNLSLAPKLNPEAVDFYKNIFRLLKQYGLTNFVTLFHFTLPSYLANIGGWTNELTVTQFALFAKLVGETFKDEIDYIITINEPMVYVYHSFISGNWPPGLTNDYYMAFRAMKNLLKGHGLAYHNLKSIRPFDISLSKHWRLFKPYNQFNPLDHYVCGLRDEVFNKGFMNALKSGHLSFPREICFDRNIANLQGYIPNVENTLDYLGINFYTQDTCQYSLANPYNIFGDIVLKKNTKTNCLGWQLAPEALYQILTTEIKPYLKLKNNQTVPVYITENGYPENHTADNDSGDWSLTDHNRCEYILSHLKVVHEAIKTGVDIRSYLYWSLIDNFEWDLGLTPRFGLIRINYANQIRDLRLSARLLGEIAQKRCIESHLLNKPLILPGTILQSKFS